MGEGESMDGGTDRTDSTDRGRGDREDRPVGIVDTHAHVNHKSFQADRDAVIEASFQEGVDTIIDVATDLESAENSLALSRRFDRLFSTIGVHPHEARLYSDADLESLMTLASDPKVKALGEMGLDYHYNFSEPEVQKHVFAWQVDRARAEDRPVVVHVRDAFDDAFEILSGGGEKWPRGVFHCFTGDRAQARVALEGGMYLSFSGIVTFKRSEELRAVAAEAPGDRILLETDCPYLAPIPRRGKRNDPTNIWYTARVVAEARGETLEDVVTRTRENAYRLFDLEPK